MDKNKLQLVPEKLAELFKKDITPEQSLAIDKAEKYGLGAEVEYAIFEEGMSPEEALREWDIE